MGFWADSEKSNYLQTRVETFLASAKTWGSETVSSAKKRRRHHLENHCEDEMPYEICHLGLQRCILEQVRVDERVKPNLRKSRTRLRLELKKERERSTPHRELGNCRTTER